jgi:subtilisin-like proprotein convertase family protein
MALPTDPLLSSQWHLRNTTPGLLDLNVFAVWDPFEGPAYTGVGTRTVVIDDGFDYNHVDLAPTYDTFLDYDFEFNTLDPFGGAGDAHGTAVAGIIGAAANGTGVVGVAHGTSLVGYRTAGIISDAWLQDIRDAIHHAAMSAQGDVANISQGIANDTASEFGVGYAAVRFDEIETSIGTAVGSGRGGLGMTIVKSAGNSRGADFDVNADDWTNDTRQVVVGAVDQNGFVSSYSSYGAALLVSAFGTPGQVLTTDRTGGAGYNLTDYTSGFNGTSAAAPMVTGVVGLMYDADPGLGWRDVQSILAVSARQVGSEVGFGIAGSERFAWGWNAAGTWNGGGQHFSNDYGYGLVDALAAVRLAETWRLTGTAAATNANEFSNYMDVLNSTVVLPDGDPAGLVFAGNAAFDDVVERVTVQMTFSTTWTGDLEVFLTSPDGTVSRLIADTGGSNDFSGTWTFESQAFRGERAAGQWLVRVADDAGGDTLTVSDIVIRTFGAATLDDRYVFTNEYSDYAGVGGHATAIVDLNGGTDTVNAAAVSSSSNIRLDGTAGWIDGVAVSFANIEHAIGGDGHDTLVGNASANQLWGMRGSDVLNGGAGADVVRGGTGNDRIVDDDFVNFDYLDGSDGVDTIDYSLVTFASGLVTIDIGAGLTSVSGGNTETVVGFENVWGSQGGEVIRGTTGVNVLLGLGGDDRIVDHDFVNFDFHDGGAGIDTIDYSSVAFASGVVTIDIGAGLASVTGGNTETILGFENVWGSQGGEVIRGTTGANVLRGNAGNDSLYGLYGTDTLVGGLGKDLLFGGPGYDRFVFESKAESPVGAGCDVIRMVDGIAFTNPGSKAGDIIDVSMIDANESVAGDQAFLFNSSQAIGTLRCVNAGSITRVFGYTDAVAGADFQIDIADGSVLASSYSAHDFVL